MYGPAIHIQRTARGYRIEQNRPAAGDALRTMDLPVALERIPGLLPICGEAQRIAATRAVYAARGDDSSPQPDDRFDETFLIEQLKASIWRFAIDWPVLLGRSPEREPMRLAMSTDKPPCLQELLIGLLDCPKDFSDFAALLRWIDGSGTVAATLVRSAVAAPSDAASSDAYAPSPVKLRNAQWILETWRQAPLKPVEEWLDEAPAAEVGALAMARHPLIRDLPGHFDLPASRLLAQVLDAVFLASATPESAAPDVLQTALAGNRAIQHGGPRVGFGIALTARGPLVHRVVLESSLAERATLWDILAPTDWHFADGGPIDRLLREPGTNAASARFGVAGFDPCAAWHVDD